MTISMEFIKFDHLTLSAIYLRFLRVAGVDGAAWRAALQMRPTRRLLHNIIGKYGGVLLKWDERKRLTEVDEMFLRIKGWRSGFWSLFVYNEVQIDHSYKNLEYDNG